MNKTIDIDPNLLAWIYDQQIEDWPGEWDFYRAMASEMSGDYAILEVGCGTGRIALRLAQQGYQVTGVDLSKEMLDRARDKSQDKENPIWIQADVQHFEINKNFGLAIIPGHSFQFMLNADAQVDCLNTIKAHLVPNAKLIVHVNHDDLKWLAVLPHEAGSRFESAGEVRLPQSDHRLRQQRAWSYDNVTQTATSVNLREELDEAGNVINSWRSDPIWLHCLFPTEIYHLAARSGFVLEAIYGDFAKNDLDENSPDIIIVLRN
jgi:SAM-dependent methyltransferase